MASFNSNSTEEPGQYPAPSWTQMGLPAQGESSGAAGSAAFSDALDKGSSNEPGQYPAQMPFAGTPLGGTGAPGTAGISAAPADGGGDSVSFSSSSPFKSAFAPGGREQGAIVHQASGQVTGKGDWTQANSTGYSAPARYQMPGTAQVSLDAGGEGAFQPGGGRVRRGGYTNGQR